MKVKVIGCGGIGLCLIPVLTRFINYSVDKFPVSEIHLIDGDVYEEKNRSRQGFSDFGPKATVTANGLRKEFGRTTIYDHPVYLDDDNIVRHIRENDLIMMCVDNHTSRKLVSERVSELDNVTLISGGNDETDGNVMIHIRRNGENITPPITQYHKEISSPKDLHPNQLNQPGSCTRIANEKPQIVIVNNLIAATMLSAFYNLTDSSIYSNRVLTNRQQYGEVFLDMLSMKAVVPDRVV